MPILETVWPRCSPVTPVGVPDPLEPRAPVVGLGTVSPFRCEGSDEGDSSSFRLLAAGVVALVLCYILRKGHMEVTAIVLERLVGSHEVVKWNQQVVPIIFGTLKTLARLPRDKHLHARRRKKIRFFIFLPGERWDLNLSCNPGMSPLCGRFPVGHWLPS